MRVLQFAVALVCLPYLCAAQGLGTDVAIVDERPEEYLLGCELDGTLFAVAADSGDVRWRLENPTKTFFRSSASMDNLTEALRTNMSLQTPLFIPSVDGGLFFFTESGVMQQLPRTAKDIIANPPYITEDGSVLIGRKDTHIYVIELATGRVIDSVVASDEDPLASVPFVGHWPPGCVLIAASTYTVKGVHPLAPENNVVLTEFTPVLTTVFDDRLRRLDFSRTSFVVSPAGDLHCVDDSSKVRWTLPWSAQLAALYRISFTSSGTGRIAREDLTLLSEKLHPSAMSLDHAPVYVGQHKGQLFAAPYKKAISEAQIGHGMLQIAPPPEDVEPEDALCLQNGSIVGLHLLPAPSTSQLPLALPAEEDTVLPEPEEPAPDLEEKSPRFPFELASFAAICVVAAGYVILDRRKKRYAMRAATLASPVTLPHMPEVAEAAESVSVKRKKKKGGRTEPGGAASPTTPVTSQPAPAETSAVSALPIEPIEPGVKRVGKIVLQMERILGYGSNGTVVYEGLFDGRKVAVKRLLRTMYDVASKEVGLFLESDEHPHVVRYFAKEEDGDFIYLALTFCLATLEDVISPSSPEKALAVMPTAGTLVTQLALGLQHLHALHIIHRDLKPANVLLDHRSIVRIADMGLARKMGPDEFSVSGGSLKSAMAGSLGWRPPEICKVHHAALADPSATSPGAARLHLSKKIDIFALGCIFYYVLTRGKHPFGQPFEREANILANKAKLDDPRCTSEAADLIRSMIQPDPAQRPTIEQVLKHPFFCIATHLTLSDRDANKKLLFFKDASDRVEVEKPNAPVVLALEARAPAVIGAAWGALVDAEMLDAGGKYRKYNFASIRDLLRVIRNKAHHYRDLPLPVQARIGSLPDGFIAYFTSRFPALIMEVYRILQQYYPGEPALKQYM